MISVVDAARRFITYRRELIVDSKLRCFILGDLVSRCPVACGRDSYRSSYPDVDTVAVFGVWT